MTPWLHLVHIIVLVHSLFVHGKRRTLLFLVAGFSLGLLAEHLGATRGWIFGKFHYQPDRIMYWGTVPIFTPLSWWLILYCAYNTTNLIVGRFDEIRARSTPAWIAMVLMACLDGLMAMNLDLLFDPIMVCPERRRWVWEYGGSYFHIPIQNFIGWFLVGFTISLIVRVYDQRWEPPVRLGRRIIDYLPPGMYLSMFVFFGLLSVLDGYPQYALIGFGAMMPFVLLAAVRGVSTIRAGAPKGKGMDRAGPGS